MIRKTLTGVGTGLGVVLGTLLLLELGSRALLVLLSDRWASPAQIRATLEFPSPPPAAPGAPAWEAPPIWMQEHVLHPYLGFVRNPALEQHSLNGSPVAERVNRFGFFGVEPVERGPGRRYRIALFGGSVAAEMFLEARDVLEHGLRDDPTLAARRIEVVCLALDGMKQPQQLLALSWLLARGARFDAIVNLDGYNEVALPFAENIPLHVAEDFPRKWRTYASRVPSPDTTVLMGRLGTERERIETLRARFAALPCRESHFCLLLWQALHRRHLWERTRLEARLRSLLAAEAPEPELTGPFEAPASETALLERLVALWRASSVQMAALARANGIPYLHFLQPNQYLEGSKVLTPRERRIAQSPSGDQYRRGAELGYPRLVAAGAALEREGVSFHDLTGLFADERGEIYKDHCCHYTRRGYERVAARIAALVVADLEAGSSNASRAVH